VERKGIMNTASLYDIIKRENIIYLNHELYQTRGMIVHYKDVTVIVVDESKIDSSTSMNTVLIQELGHYFSGSYYHAYSNYEVVTKAEIEADKKAWEVFFPYFKIKELMQNGLSSASQIANYFDVEVDYMARCLNYYYDKYNGFL